MIFKDAKVQKTILQKIVSFCFTHPFFRIFANFLNTFMKIQSNKENISITPDRVFHGLLNFTRNTTAPSIPQLSNWVVTDDGCSFTINNMVTCHFRIVEQIPYSKVSYHIDTDKNFSATADVHIDDLGYGSTVQIFVDADVPFFLQPMIKGPIEQALNKALLRIKEMVEKN